MDAITDENQCHRATATGSAWQAYGASVRAVDVLDTPKGTLEAVLKEEENLQGVIVLKLYKDGTQMLDASMMSFYEKNFLVAFAQAWVNRWFNSMRDTPK